MTTTRHSLLALLVLASCSSPAPDLDDPDAGAPGEPDAGSPLADAGQPGTVDAGPDDPDAAPPESLPPIERAHDGGKPGRVTLAGGLTYVGVGPRLEIFDPSGQPGPVRVGGTEPLPGLVHAVAVVGDRAFVAESGWNDGRLRVFDVSDPTDPIETASLRLGDATYSRPVDVAVAGDRLYVADRWEGVFEVDVTDADAPVVLGKHEVAGALAVQIAGDRLYVVGWTVWGGRYVTARDRTAGLATIPGGLLVPTARELTITPQHLAVAATDAGVEVHDLTDFGQPKLLRKLAGIDSRAIGIADRRAWVGARDGVYRIDLANPNAIGWSGPFAIPSRASTSVAVEGSLLVTATDRATLTSADLSALPQSVATATLGLCTTCTDVATDGDRIVVTDSSVGMIGGVSAGSLHDLSVDGRRDGDEVAYQRVALGGGQAFVADSFFGVRIFSLSASRAPAPFDQIAMAGYPRSLVTAGDRLYVSHATNGGSIDAYDLVAPASPIWRGTISAGLARGLAASDGLLYVADEGFAEAAGLRIIDVRDPGSMVTLGLYDGCSDPQGVAVRDSIAVVACGFDGFHIVDVSTPSAPTLIVRRPVPDPVMATAVALGPDHAYLGHSLGVMVLEISRPHQPTIAASWATASEVRALTLASPTRLVAATGAGGIYQWELD